MSGSGLGEGGDAGGGLGEGSSKGVGEGLGGVGLGLGLGCSSSGLGLGDGLGEGLGRAGDGLGSFGNASGHISVGKAWASAGGMPGGTPQLPNTSLLYLTCPWRQSRVQPGPTALYHCTNALLGPQDVPQYVTVRIVRAPQGTGVLSVTVTPKRGVEPVELVALTQVELLLLPPLLPPLLPS